VRALLAVLVALLAAPATASAAIPTIGIGEQHPDLFTQARFQALGVQHVRYIASWDTFASNWQRAEVDAYMQAADAAGVKVLLGFGRSRDRRKARKLPSVKAYSTEVAKFRQRYPQVDEYVAWNEANHCSQPTCRNPARAAQYYLALRRRCQGCTVLGASLLDSSNMVKWAKAFERAAGSKRRIVWGLHNYIDANLFRTRGTRALLKAVKGQVWFTETGGIVKRNNDSALKFPESPRHAAKATTFVFKLAALSPRVRRVYFYHWAPAPTKRPTWDSALVDLNAQPRPAYDVLLRWLQRHDVARSSG
jgi:hypothetical protein